MKNREFTWYDYRFDLSFNGGDVWILRKTLEIYIKDLKRIIEYHNPPVGKGQIREMSVFLLDHVNKELAEAEDLLSRIPDLKENEPSQNN